MPTPPAPDAPAAVPSILVVEDDPQLLDMLEEVLTEEGYAVSTARDAQRALHHVLTVGADLLLLDRGLPGMEGLDLLGRLRGAGVETPVLILSARGTPADRVDGLDAGAEDYLTKPFDLSELLARLRSLRRRHRDGAARLRLPGERVLDTAAHEVIDGEERIVLTARESALLEVLARSPAQVFERASLLRLAMPGAEELGVVDTCIHYLRRKLGRGVVATVRGVGYRLGSR